MRAEQKKISLFKNAIDSKPENLTLNDYFKSIRDGRWQDAVLNYRAGRCEKTSIPAVTASGTFSGRKDADLSEHSGIIAIDIDARDQKLSSEEVKSSLLELPELFAIHASLGGKGLVAYFRVSKAKHAESFEAITKMLANDYEVVADMHCSNISRLRFVSYDPSLHVNYDAVTWKHFEKKDRKHNEATYNYHIYSDNDVDFILSQIKSRCLDIAPDYYSWLRIGFALASKLGEAGRGAFKLISSFYSGKNKINVDKQYDLCLKSDAVKGGRTSIKTFFYYAKNAGCDLVCPRTHKIKTIGKLRRKQEQNNASGAIINGRKDAKEYLEKFEGITGEDVDAVLDQVWATPISELQSDDGLLFDLELFLKSNYTFRYNEITNKIECDGEPMTDYLQNSIYIRALKTVSDKVTDKLIGSLLCSDFTKKFNPIMDFIERHKHIKTSGNIDKLAECINSNISNDDADFVRYFLEKWLISIIASAHGIYSILCFVLTGAEQGTNKSSFFRELLPVQLRDLFATNKLEGKESDYGTIMCSKLIVLDDEFGSKNKQDEKRFKELISKDVFTIRAPYGRFFEDKRRLAVLCGTSNEEQVVNDLTGNRRIIPIQTNFIDIKKYNEIDKTKLFVEMYHKFRDDNTGWFLSKDDIKRLNDVCFDSAQVSAEVELPAKYFAVCERDDHRATFMSASEIRAKIEQFSGIKMSPQKLSIALNNLGYIKERRRINGFQVRGFIVDDLTRSWKSE